MTLFHPDLILICLPWNKKIQVTGKTIKTKFVRQADPGYLSGGNSERSG